MLELSIEIAIDPIEVQVEPLGVGWTQRVELAPMLVLAVAP